MTIDIWQSMFIGALQGATEFLPVSSDGHLVVIPALLGWPHPSLTYDVAVHMGTTLAVLLYFRRDWVRLIAGGWRGLRLGAPWRDVDGRLLCVIVAANVPAGLAGITFKDWFEAQFSVPRLAAGLLIVNAVILVAAEWIARSRAGAQTGAEAGAPADAVHRVGLARGLAMGVAQIAAILPGISRSGTTIATGLALGVTREAAARFSFLMAAPIIVAAGLLQAVEVLGDPVARGAMEPGGIVAAGCVAAFLVGIAAIAGLLRFVRRSPLYVFAAWCVGVGVIGLWRL
ncbi:MAG: undecaprenyl-diphosphate phosphatase [Ardenticatenales bacterium]|nr:undecaprenyl-diphosphate phosphatase [Ardenticatenales bacterium]